MTEVRTCVSMNPYFRLTNDSHYYSPMDIDIIGRKGAALCDLYHLGMVVPPAFVISAENSIETYSKNGSSDKRLDKHLINDYRKAVHELEEQTGKIFGEEFPPASELVEQHSTKLPLLFSVRSSAPVSLPGMTETVLNLGVNDEIVKKLARTSNNPRWAYDTYRRFLQMFGNIVMGVDKKLYENILEAARNKAGVAQNYLLTAEDLMEVVEDFKALAVVPDDPWEQLQLTIEAMFRSWYSPRAVKYRDVYNIDNALGTAVIVQSMVYGNMSGRSGSGIAFTRNPDSGAKELSGEYLANAEVNRKIYSFQSGT